MEEKRNKEVLLQISGLKKSYKITKEYNLEVLKGIDLKIYKEEIIAIVGKSGAGKSTLLHILGALDSPDTGKVFFDGNDIFQYSEKDLAKFRNKEVGFIFQFHHLLPEFTAFENVLIANMIGGNADKKRVTELLEIVGLSSRASHKPNELSGGEAQRVAFARALMNSPRMILGDEPTGNLDTQNANSVIDLLFELRDKFKQTFVIVTHNEEFASKCDRVIKLEDGKVVN
ncbi:ABC transporter ATP-binding protein [soil metagenome]